jgi:hypothetical protein
MSYSNGPRIVTDGLVLCLDAGNNKSYPGTGTTWTDLSGNGNNGTMSSVNYNSNNNGNLIFDGAVYTAGTDYIMVPHNSIFNFNSTFTLSVWIKINTLNLASIYNILSKKTNFNNTQKGWSCQLDYRGTGIVHYRNNNGLVTNDSTQDSTVNNTSLLNQISSYKNIVWVIKQSPATVSFYIDGILRSGPHAITHTNTDTSNNLYIGKTLGSSGDGSPPMSIGQISLYNRSLSVSEIQQNYNCLKGRFNL